MEIANRKAIRIIKKSPFFEADAVLGEEEKKRAHKGVEGLLQPLCGLLSYREWHSCEHQ